MMLFEVVSQLHDGPSSFAYINLSIEDIFNRSGSPEIAWMTFRVANGLEGCAVIDIASQWRHTMLRAMG